MMAAVSQVAVQLETRGLLTRANEQKRTGLQAFAVDLLGGALPADLAAFYAEDISRLGDFTAVRPTWTAHSGWCDNGVSCLLSVHAIPLFDDGCGNLFGMDLTPDAAPRAVYFFDHERGFEAPEWAAGSSLARFLLYLADADRALDEGWPARWVLKHDPDIERCPRAPAIWNAG